MNSRQQRPEVRRGAGELRVLADARVRDARPQGREPAARASMRRGRADGGRGGGPAPLATVVSLPTARAARLGAPAANTPESFCSNQL